MAFDSHIVTVRRLKKYIDDVIGKKANLPNNTKTIVDNLAGLFDVYHPVGSLYSTTDANFNPNTAKGWHGTWERIKDCVIYAAGDSDKVGSIVGSNTHTLTEAELPKHRHTIPSLSGSTNEAGVHHHAYYLNSGINVAGGGSDMKYKAINTWGAETTAGATADAGKHTHTVTTNASNTGYTGSGTTIDIRPRRLNSVVWRRTA